MNTNTAPAPRCLLTWDIYPGRVEYVIDGRRRHIDGVTYSADLHAAKISYNGGRSFIRLAADHVNYTAVALAAGYIAPENAARAAVETITAGAHVITADALYLVVTPRDKKRRKSAEKTVPVVKAALDNLLTALRFTAAPDGLHDVAAALQHAARVMQDAKLAATAAKRFEKVAAWLDAQAAETPAAETAPAAEIPAETAPAAEIAVTAAPLTLAALAAALTAPAETVPAPAA